MLAFSSTQKERFSNVLEMKTHEQNKHNKRTEIEWFDWFIEQIQMRLAFGWLRKPSDEKNFKPKNFLEINHYFTLTSCCSMIGQSNNAFSILGFSLAGKGRGHVLIFIHWLIKQITNTYRNHFSRSYKNRSKCSPTNSLAVTSSIPLSTAEANSIPIFIGRNT